MSVRCLGAEVRGVVEALKAQGGGDIVLGADGQQVEERAGGDAQAEQGDGGEVPEGEEEGVPEGHTKGEAVGICELEFVPMSMAEVSFWGVMLGRVVVQWG